MRRINEWFGGRRRSSGTPNSSKTIHQSVPNSSEIVHQTEPNSSKTVHQTVPDSSKPALQTVPDSSKPALQTVTDGAAQFSTDLFKVIGKEQPGNLIISPLSVEVVVSMAAYGAGGETAKQMRKALHLPADDSIGRSGFQALIITLNNVTDVVLHVANKVYTKVGFTIESEFQEITSKFFLSESQQLDFKNAQQSASTINSWCEQHTNNRIKDVVKPDDITKDTYLVLVNAVYFKGSWEEKFDAADTKNRDFHIDENTVKKVPTMCLESRFRYGKFPDVKASFIELPYEGDQLSMIIILPDEIDGLKNVEADLEKLSMTRLLREGYKQKVHLYLPKFKIVSTIPLNDVLGKLGMTDMFTDAANFSGISDIPLKVSKVIQKAFIEVNEEGSEAAAVTTVTMCRFRRMPPPPVPPVIMAIDRPFLSIILHRGIQTSLFYSRVLSTN